MPNIGTVLREEISRLSRKESRGQLDSTRKATNQHRREIASLKRQVAQLERAVKLLLRDHARLSTKTADAGTKRVRFVAKGLKTMRQRLGLSAAQLGTLVGASAQSIYNWEQKAAEPRPEHVRKLAALRSLGKREVARKLEQLKTATR